MVIRITTVVLMCICMGTLPHVNKGQQTVGRCHVDGQGQNCPRDGEICVLDPDGGPGQGGGDGNSGNPPDGICVCAPGYFGSPPQCTTDRDECARGEDTCSINAFCRDTTDSYVCTCRTGYQGNGEVCDNIDECQSGGNSCSPNALCSDTVGSYTCTCNTGYVGNGFTCLTNECARGEDTCSINAFCQDTTDSYVCTCRTGYQGNGEVCDNIDECQSGGNRCSPNALCSDTVGSYTCTCNTGYVGNGFTCQSTTNNGCTASSCSPNADCFNIGVSSFRCVCKSGYQGDGQTCTSAVCRGNSCSPKADCVNIDDSSFRCICKSGYEGDGQTCIRINQCLTDVNCPTNAFCLNTDGSYECRCKDNYNPQNGRCTLSTTIIAITSVVASIISMLIIGGIAACCYHFLCSGRSDSRPIRDRPSRDPTVVVNNIQAGPKSERPPPVRPPPVRPPPVRPLPRLRPMPSFWHPPRPQPEPLCSSLRWKSWHAPI